MSENWTALHFAAYTGAVDVAHVLLAHGASLTVRDRHGNTPLGTATSYNQGGVATVLREAGGKLD